MAKLIEEYFSCEPEEFDDEFEFVSCGECKNRSDVQLFQFKISSLTMLVFKKTFYGCNREKCAYENACEAKDELYYGFVNALEL